MVEPTRADVRTASLGKWLIASGVMIAGLLAVVAVLGLTVFRQVHIIDALASGVSQQRSQFDACKGKPASTIGCITPVAAEPSVIVKQGSRGPIGVTGPQGPPGPQGLPGPVGKPGPMGKAPACLLLVSACSGAQGPEGKQGPAGTAGKDGEQGPAGKDGGSGQQGPAGELGSIGPQGPVGVSVVDTDCLGDGPDSYWRTTYSNGTTTDTQGPCRIGPSPAGG